MMGTGWVHDGYVRGDIMPKFPVQVRATMSGVTQNQ